MEDGKLSTPQQEKAKKWLESKFAGGLSCPVCRSRTWVLAEHFVQTPIMYQSAVIIGGETYPSIHVACQNCGLTLLFNAIMIGLLQPPSKEQQ